MGDPIHYHTNVFWSDEDGSFMMMLSPTEGWLEGARVHPEHRRRLPLEPVVRRPAEDRGDLDEAGLERLEPHPFGQPHQRRPVGRLRPRLARHHHHLGDQSRTARHDLVVERLDPRLLQPAEVGERVADRLDLLERGVDPLAPCLRQQRDVVPLGQVLVRAAQVDHHPVLLERLVLPFEIGVGGDRRQARQRLGQGAVGDQQEPGGRLAAHGSPPTGRAAGGSSTISTASYV